MHKCKKKKNLTSSPPPPPQGREGQKRRKKTRLRAEIFLQRSSFLLDLSSSDLWVFFSLSENRNFSGVRNSLKDRDKPLKESPALRWFALCYTTMLLPPPPPPPGQHLQFCTALLAPSPSLPPISEFRTRSLSKFCDPWDKKATILAFLSCGSFYSSSSSSSPPPPPPPPPSYSRGTDLVWSRRSSPTRGRNMRSEGLFFSGRCCYHSNGQTEKRRQINSCLCSKEGRSLIYKFPLLLLFRLLCKTVHHSNECANSSSKYLFSLLFFFPPHLDSASRKTECTHTQPISQADI